MPSPGETGPEAPGFPPISDYGIIGDCRTAALVARNGGLEWLCLPDFDSAPVFARILDREKGGHLTLRPAGAASVRRRYLDETNVLETEFEHAGGRLRVVDFLPVAEEGAASLQPEREVVRLVEALEGETDVELIYAPRPDFGRRPVRLAERRGLGWVAARDNPLYLLRSDIPLCADEDRTSLRGRERLAEGERRFVSLSVAQREPAVIPGDVEDAARKLDRTVRWWRDWCAQCTYDGPYRDAVLRSALTLKALQFCLSGAVVAAPTTSLPEQLGSDKNWDYRYCWLRDAGFTLRAFIELGFAEEADDFFAWLMHATRLTQPRLQVMYDVYGRTDLPERSVGGLAGYRGSAPVRTGNAAAFQFQTDVYGYVIDAAADYVGRGYELGRNEKRTLRRFGDSVCDLWREPDNGIWEFRGDPRQNTWSKVMCWAALDKLLALDEKGALSVDRDRLERAREEIREAVMASAFSDELDSFVGDFAGSYTDATLLLMPRSGFLDPRDPRMAGTFERIRDRLTSGALVHRYESAGEGAFVICSFWAIDYLARAGRLDEAKDRMDELLALRNDLGLLSEEVDPESGLFLGNFPQAFSHSGLINAALAIAAAEKEDER